MVGKTMTSDPPPTPLSELLHRLRQEAGLSLYELAKRSGVGRPKLLRIETGEIRTPTVEILDKIALALQADPESFYDAVWQTTDDPLPSLPTYFRAKHQLTDEEIARLERTLKRTISGTDRGGGKADKRNE